eukprot:TRINITY_DN7960_c0_g1_i1.p1 TRINITY_DN7960_c0_g1~~TRINITY_DN7960_c0_g1_i1.p1  ORF type:complete len:274 (+),score=37.76 TRINITY_DN7960_c0_g1_i1:37-822(+)
MQDLFVQYPVECAILMRRVLLIGCGPFTVLAAHNALLLRRAWQDEPADERGLEFTALWAFSMLRLVAFVPRPFLWYCLLQMYNHARRLPSPQQIGEYLTAIQHTWQVKVNMRLTQFAYFYLTLTFLWTWSAWDRYPTATLARQLFAHCCCSVLVMASYQLCAVFFFYRLLNADLDRGVSREVLEKHSCLTVFGEEPERDKEELEETCSICFHEYATGDTVRKLLCRHNFHARCIDHWLVKRKNLCPLCARPVGASADAASN